VSTFATIGILFVVALAVGFAAASSSAETTAPRTCASVFWSP
jgi:hypothetical protein